MQKPNTQQIEAFMHGMQHALTIAEGRKRGKLSTQSHAIRSEIASLRLMAETVNENDNEVVAPRPIPVRFQSRIQHVSKATIIGEALFAFAVVLGPFIFLWAHFLFTGKPLNFMGGE